MRSAVSALGVGLCVLVVLKTTVLGHCQVPCGIYGDDLRFALMREHVTTIEKSMREVVRLEQASAESANQLVRWVSNKEQHADELSQLVTYYFMAQRVKPLPAGAGREQTEKYTKEIALLHEMLVLSMKAKQTTDLQNCARLREAIDAFEKSYKGE